MIGVLLLLLLAALSVAAIFEMMISPRSTKSMDITTTRVAALRVAIAAYKKSHGGTAGIYPPTLSALVTTDGTACTAINTPATTATYLTLQGWCGPYIDSVFTQVATDFMNDGWEQPFQWVQATGVITSCGPDQVCGTGDDIVFNP